MPKSNIMPTAAVEFWTGKWSPQPFFCLIFDHQSAVEFQYFFSTVVMKLIKIKSPMWGARYGDRMSPWLHMDVKLWGREGKTVQISDLTVRISMLKDGFGGIGIHQRIERKQITRLMNQWFISLVMSRGGAWVGKRQRRLRIYIPGPQTDPWPPYRSLAHRPFTAGPARVGLKRQKWVLRGFWCNRSHPL